MGVEKSGTPHKRNATKYLRDTEPGDVLNRKTGLYEPASGYDNNYRYELPPSGIGSQRPKGSLADWVSSIANFAAAFLSVITVGLIVIGASLTVRQWVEARRTADASVAAVEESIRANAANSKDSDRAYGLSREALEDVQRAFVYAEPVMVAMPN